MSKIQEIPFTLKILSKRLSVHSFIFCFMMALGLTLVGCDNNNYDDGYEAAWNDEEKPFSMWASSERIEGYQHGREDSFMYDEGYYAGRNGHKPKYFKDEFYMEGFADGKKYKAQN